MYAEGNELVWVRGEKFWVNTDTYLSDNIWYVHQRSDIIAFTWIFGSYAEILRLKKKRTSLTAGSREKYFPQFLSLHKYFYQLFLLIDKPTILHCYLLFLISDQRCLLPFNRQKTVGSPTSTSDQQKKLRIRITTGIDYEQKPKDQPNSAVGITDIMICQ